MPASASTVLTHAHIQASLSKSVDDGSTLDLTHLHLTDVTEFGAEELVALLDHQVARRLRPVHPREQ